MKTKPNFLLISSLLGGILFNYLFWEERLAVNLLIYSLFILTITYLNKEINKGVRFKIYGLLNLMAALLVVINDTDLSIITYYISLMLFVGFNHYPNIKTVFTGFWAAGLQLITAPFNLIRRFFLIQVGHFKFQSFIRPAKYMFLPMLIIISFTCLYSLANQVFSTYLNMVLTSISDFMTHTFRFIFDFISLPRLFNICFGIIFSGGLLITFYNKSLQNAESQCSEQLIRTRKKSKYLALWTDLFQNINKGSLKTAYITGIVSFSGLNLLLLVVNLIDISTLWFSYKPSGNFSADLHQGTNALIFSIVMAMVVILCFFRGNLNFYHKNKALKILAYTWMFQNLLLIISVFIRDFYYIEFHGLTHKRIGVLVFATLCIIGLASVYVKVARQKTLFYLFKVNGNIWFASLLILSFVNWDLLIVKYNFSNADRIALDPVYMLSLSDKTLPVIAQNKAKIYSIHGKKQDNVSVNISEQELEERLNTRIEHFKARYYTGWLSWNLQDWKTARYFKLNKPGRTSNP